MRAIIGLGNPGPQYQKTRHNAGFWVIDVLAERWGIPLTCSAPSAFASQLGQGQHNGASVVLVQPQTYMNRSGEAAARIRDFYQLAVSDFLILHDDLDLPLGRIRIKRGGGGAGGNRGVASLIEILGSKDFPRVKIGVGRPPDHIPVVDFVLQRFTPQEEASMLGAAQRAADAVEAILARGIQQAMDGFNRPNSAVQI